MKKMKISALFCVVILLLSACSTPKIIEQETAEDILANEKIEGEISVSLFKSKYRSLIEEAARKFEEKYPGTKVIVEYFGSLPEVGISESGDGDTNEQTQLDYINRTNTELMSGRGSDVLTFDILPFYKYAQNGSLVNLRDLMDNDPDFIKEDYRMNIFDAVSDDKGQFMMPADYQFRYFMYDGTLFNESQRAELSSLKNVSFEQLVEFGTEAFNIDNQNTQEHTYMFGYHPGILLPSLFELLFYQNYGSFLDIQAKKVNFNDGLFSDMLNLINEYARTGIIKDGKGKGDDDGRYGGFINGYTTTETLARNFNMELGEHFFFSSNDSISLLYPLTRNTEVKSFSIFSTATGTMENNEFSGLVSNKNGDASFTCNSYGINSNSVNKRTAWEFVKFLVSEEMQKSINLIDSPVHKNAARSRIKREIAGSLFSLDWDESMAELDADRQRVFDAYISQLDKYTNAINTFYIRDAVIDNLINSEVECFFDGTKTAEEVADVLQNKITLYLNE